MKWSGVKFLKEFNSIFLRLLRQLDYVGLVNSLVISFQEALVSPSPAFIKTSSIDACVWIKREGSSSNSILNNMANRTVIDDDALFIISLELIAIVSCMVVKGMIKKKNSFFSRATSNPQIPSANRLSICLPRPLFSVFYLIRYR